MTKKYIAKDFLKLAAKGHSHEAFRLYVGKNFKHHNVYFKGDANTLMLAMEESSRLNPNKIFEIHHAIADKDMRACEGAGAAAAACRDGPDTIATEEGCVVRACARCHLRGRDIAAQIGELRLRGARHARRRNAVNPLVCDRRSRLNATQGRGRGVWQLRTRHGAGKIGERKS